MKKKLFAIVIMTALLISSLCLVLAACDPDAARRNIPGWEDGKTNLIYYTWGSDEENEIFQEVIDAYEAKHEDVNIILSKAGNDYYGDLDLQLSGRVPPDIVQMKPGYIVDYLETGAIASLQEYIDKSTVITSDMIWDFNDGYRYNPQTNVVGNHEDDIYSLVKDFSCDFVMNYNKNLVSDSVKNLDYPKDANNYPSMTSPMTWSQYMNFAGAMQSGSTDGAALDNEPFQQLLEWIQQAGGSLWSEDHKSVVDIKNNAPVRAAFEYYRMLRDKSSSSPSFNPDNTGLASNIMSKPLSATTAVQVGPAQLKQRQAASIFIGRWAYTTYEMDSNKAKCDTGFAPPPVPNGMTVDENTKYAGITAMVGMSIASKSTNKDAAWDFIEFYFTEGQKMLAKKGYNIPGNRQVAANEFLNDAELSAKEKEVNKFFYDLALNHGFVINFNRYISQYSVEQTLSAKLSAYFAKSGAFDKTAWEACLDEIRTDLQAKLDRATR